MYYLSKKNQVLSRNTQKYMYSEVNLKACKKLYAANTNHKKISMSAII